MRICISGCAGSGKSTLVKAFLNRWQMYTTPMRTYRDVIIENKLDHSSKTSAESQLEILDFMMIEHEKYPKEYKVIFDRCPWDNLAYTLLGNANNLISDEVTAATISLVKESMKNIDMIFWLKHDPNIKIVEDGLRDTNLKFILDSDSIFKDLFHQYCENLESDIFYPKEDCPAILQMEGSTVDDRLQFIGEFIDYKGDLIETKDSILDPSNVELLEKMIKEQQSEISNEFQIKNIMKQVGKFTI